MPQRLERRTSLHEGLDRSILDFPESVKSEYPRLFFPRQRARGGRSHERDAGESTSSFVRGRFPVRGYGHQMSAPLALMFNSR